LGTGEWKPRRKAPNLDLAIGIRSMAEAQILSLISG
jgi:hypothetical protein